MRDRIAKVFALISHPIFIPLWSIWLIAHFHFVVSTKLIGSFKTLFLGLFSTSLFVIPVLGLLLLLKKYRISDLVNLNPAERRMSLLVMSVIYGFIAFTFNSFFIDRIIPLFLYATVLTTALAFFIEYFQKISLHMLGWGGFTALLIVLSRNSTVRLDWLVFASVLLGIAVALNRRYTKSHQLKEIYLGYSIGFIVNTIFYLFNYGF